jgi:putative tricarboxylic transport membrane protein
MSLPKGGKSELTFVGSLFLVGVVVFWDTWRSENPSFNLTISPKLFPYLIAGFLMIATSVLAVKIVLGDAAIPEGLNAGDKIEKSDFKTFTLVLSSLLAYLVLIERAGFIVAASITFFGITVAFGNKKHLKSAVFGTLFIIAIYISFTRFLNVQLPSGIF